MFDNCIYVTGRKTFSESASAKRFEKYTEEKEANIDNKPKHQ